MAGGDNVGTYLSWYGGSVLEHQLEKAVLVVEHITQAAAAYARAHHEWSNRTGETEGSVWSGSAQVDGLEVKCLWGADGAAKWLEYGTQKMDARPWLRPAMDATYRLANFAGLFGDRVYSQPGWTQDPSAFMGSASPFGAR